MTRNLYWLCLSPIALTLAGGCGSDIGLGVVDARVTFSPPLIDCGDTPVGTVCEEKFELAHDQGAEVTITNITLNNIDGEFFSLVDYSGEDIKLVTGETLEILVQYSPEDVGYHRASIDVATNAREQNVSGDMRGRGLLPEGSCYPLGVDFGPVAVGDSPTQAVTVVNQSDLTLSVTSSNSANDRFALITDLTNPLDVLGGNEKQVDIMFTPDSDQPQSGTLTLRAGDVEICEISLRGNDCENGDPNAYDQDGDGYTLCGGDCDDLNALVRPGGDENSTFGVDDDCDGEIDEDTPWADDDGDGYCDDDVLCSDGTIPGDCSDSSDLGSTSDQVNPGVEESEAAGNMNNGIDDDCDGVVDQGTTDFDGDGYSVDGGDCDDNEATVYPGAPELPDYMDNNCDAAGLIDETTVLYDDDNDGFCDDPIACSDGSSPGDCDDSWEDLDGDGVADGLTTNPGVGAEIADWRDNDCDGTVDEGTVNYDDDGDGYTENGGDCNDADPLVSPAFGTIC